MAKSAKPNPFAKKSAAGKTGAKEKMPMHGGKPHPFAPKGGKGMVAPPARKAK